MKIIRKEGDQHKVIASYEDITLSAGNHFINHAAQKEYDKRPADAQSICVTNDEEPLDRERIRHTAAIIGEGKARLVEFFGIWPDNDGNYKLPPGTVEEDAESPLIP